MINVGFACLVLERVPHASLDYIAALLAHEHLPRTHDNNRELLDHGALTFARLHGGIRLRLFASRFWINDPLSH